MTAAGDVSDYDAATRSSLVSSMAATLGVSAVDVSLAVTAASVHLVFSVTVADGAAAAAVSATVASALPTAAAASSLLGASVLSAPTAVTLDEDVSPPPSPPPLPPTPPGHSPPSVPWGPLVAAVQEALVAEPIDGALVAALLSSAEAAGVPAEALAPLRHHLEATQLAALRAVIEALDADADAATLAEVLAAAARVGVSERLLADARQRLEALETPPAAPPAEVGVGGVDPDLDGVENGTTAHLSDGATEERSALLVAVLAMLSATSLLALGALVSCRLRKRWWAHASGAQWQRRTSGAGLVTSPGFDGLSEVTSTQAPWTAPVETDDVGPQFAPNYADLSPESAPNHAAASSGAASEAKVGERLARARAHNAVRAVTTRAGQPGSLLVEQAAPSATFASEPDLAAEVHEKL